MRFAFAFVAALAFLEVAPAADPPEPSAAVIKQVGGDKVIALIRGIESVEAFHVGGIDTKKSDDSYVANREIVGKGAAMPKDFAAKLTAALLADDTYFKNDSKGTGKGTAVGFRGKTTAGGIVEVSCCLEKGNTHLRVVDAAGKVLISGDVRGFRNAEEAPLRILAAEAFPDDPVIQKFKPKPVAERPPPKKQLPPIPSPIVMGAQLIKVADGFKFAEGPSADKDGNIYFTDQPTDRILIWPIEGKLTTFVEKSGRANGLCFDPDGKLWACSDEKNELRRYDVATKEYTIMAKDYMGKLLNGPNDVWVAPNGGAYFSDPYYKRMWWTREKEEQDSRGVYYVSPKGAVSRAAADFMQPNGVVGTADGKTLYVADIKANRTFAFDIQEDGTLTNRRKFCDTGSDGMTVDADGNVYLTRGTVVVFDKAGRKITDLAVPENPSNVCFGGKDQKTLFVTAQKGLYSIQMKVAGGARQ